MSIASSTPPAEARPMQAVGHRAARLVAAFVGDVDRTTLPDGRVHHEVLDPDTAEVLDVIKSFGR